MQLDTAYYSEQPVKVPGDREDEDGADGDRKGDDRSPGGTSGKPAVPPAPETVAPGGKPLSARLFDELSMQRRDVLAATLLGHPGLALDRKSTRLNSSH